MPHHRIAVVGHFLFNPAESTLGWVMFKSMLMGLFVIALVSWGIGAYNRMVKLRAAMALAYASWQNALANQANDASAVKEDGSAQPPKADLEAAMLKDAYLASVFQYNQAIAQIPAAWIATLFGFGSAYFEESKH